MTISRSKPSHFCALLLAAFLAGPGEPVSAESALGNSLRNWLMPDVDADSGVLAKWEADAVALSITDGTAEVTFVPRAGEDGGPLRAFPFLAACQWSVDKGMATFGTSAVKARVVTIVALRESGFSRSSRSASFEVIAGSCSSGLLGSDT